MVEGLTDYALIGFMAVDSALCLELGLNHIQRAGRDAGDEAASCASWGGRMDGWAGKAELRDRTRMVRFWISRLNGGKRAHRSCCLRFLKASLEVGAAGSAAE